MVLKIVAIGVFAAVVVLATGVVLFMKSNGMIEHGKRVEKVPWYPIKNGKAPLGVVCIVDPEAPTSVSRDCVGVWAFNQLYASIGVTSHAFEQWEEKHGIASLGVDASGKTLAPGYPVLSKVAWMSIEPVTLTQTETSDLIRECERAVKNSMNDEAQAELEAIRTLAEKALASSAVVRFGHP